MARIEEIKNITDLLGFVYDPDTLPTAIILMDNMHTSVHALRAGEQGLIELLIEKDGEKIDEKTGELSHVVKAYRFWDDFPNLEAACWGCYYSAIINEKRNFRNIEDWATKTFEECA